MRFNPVSGLGQLQSEIDNVKQKLNQKAESYEIVKIHQHVDRLECTMREIGTALDGLCFRIEALEKNSIN